MVIPCINARSEAEAKSQLEKIAPLGASLIHWDITDGVFTPHISWGETSAVQKLLTTHYQLPTAKLEIHLMVDHPESVLDKWLETGNIGRVIVHADAEADVDSVRAKCMVAGVECMLAITPETKLDAIREKRIDDEGIQVLAVTPGPSGQAFNPAMVERVRLLRDLDPRAIIEVDGGINPETLKLYKAAGATDFVAATYIVKAKDPRKAYEELVKIAEE